MKGVQYNLLFQTVFLLFLLNSSTSCAQSARKLRVDGEKYFESRQFDHAVTSAINSLYKKPDKNKKAQELLQLSFPRFVTDYKDQIARLKASSKDFQDDKTVDMRKEIVVRYEKLINVAKDIQNLPPEAFIVKRSKPISFEYEDFYEKLAEAKSKLNSGIEDAAEYHYQEALRLMELGGLENSKTAAKTFKKAMSYVPDYKDSADKYETARKAGTLRLAIIPFDNKSGTSRYGAVGEMITDKTISTLFKDKSAMEFLEIIDREQLELVLQEQKLGVSGILDDNTLVELGKVLGVHQIMTGRITQIISDREKVNKKNYPEEKTIKVKVGTKKNDKGKEEAVYADRKVKATVTMYKKEAGARMEGAYKVIDVQTAKLVKSDSFSERYDFECTWGSFYGDARALSYNSNRLVKQQEQNPLSDGERVNEMGKKLAVNLAKTIKQYVQ
ncbi:CsgG/HfaB family protein [Rapidithrix thailandica]|uniref:CsgG/HfaB family protein n=1 Tax=Rapidithrix thailandica TaxID=413964 RepID=A0AAW9S2Q9_9BACT